MARSWTLPAHEVHRGMDLLEAVHHQNAEKERRLVGFWRQFPDVVRARRPMWEVMADLGETIVLATAGPGDHPDPGAGTPDTSRGQIPQGRLSEAYAETLQDLGKNYGGPYSSSGIARAILRYLALGEGGTEDIENRLFTLRPLLLGEKTRTGSNQLPRNHR